MNEIYTCVCGGERWKIFGTEIECDKCGKEYTLKGLDGEMENPKNFNERIRKSWEKKMLESIKDGTIDLEADRFNVE